MKGIVGDLLLVRSFAFEPTCVFDKERRVKRERDGGGAWLDLPFFYWGLASLLSIHG